MRDSLSMIPLSALAPSKQNVRKTNRSQDIKELAASIEAHGLIQNLMVVRSSAKRETYEVIAGGRRLAALKLLVRRKRLAKDMLVPCRVVTEKDAATTELSLAENVFRAPLHPADQFEAFSKLQSEGLGSEDIAARFGITPNIVLQRLKLAAVSPILMAVYRDDGMTLDQLTAFAISDDHANQERVWSDDPRRGRPAQAIRRDLTRALVGASDRRARFVGVAAYEAAGGTILRDLFQPEEEGYFTDTVLLDGLASEQLAAAAGAVAAEGWQWIEVQPELNYEYLARFGRVPPTTEERSVEDRKLIGDRVTQYDEMVSNLEDDAPQEEQDRLDALDAEIQSLSEPCEQWDEEAKTRGGAYVAIGYEGDLVVIRGLLKAEENGPERIKKPKLKGNGIDSIPDAVRESLSAHRTVALRVELGRNPQVALLALLHTLVLRVFYGTHHTACVDMRPAMFQLGPLNEELGESPAVKAFAEDRLAISGDLPEIGELWTWLSARDIDANLVLLAHCTASTVNAVWGRTGNGQEDRLAEADMLATAVRLDMASWWQPTRLAYLDRVTKDGILHAVTEGVSQAAAENISALKKGPMAGRAEELLKETGWLPEPLRAKQPNEAATV